jgi:hypothetical protein
MPNNTINTDPIKATLLRRYALLVRLWCTLYPRRPIAACSAMAMNAMIKACLS